MSGGSASVRAVESSGDLKRKNVHCMVVRVPEKKSAVTRRTLFKSLRPFTAISQIRHKVNVIGRMTLYEFHR